MRRFLPAIIFLIIAIVVSGLSPALGFGAFAGQSEETDQMEEVTVLPDQVAVVSTENSLVAYGEGETVQVLNELNRYTWFQHEDKARDDFCWFATDHAEEKGWTLESVEPLPEWEPCGQASSNAGAETQATSGGGCTAWTETHDPAIGDWGLSNNGPMIVHFWSNRTTDQAEYKLYLRGGSYALPGGGKVYKYPGGCDEQASVEYDVTEHPEITLDRVMSLAGIVSGGNSSGGNNSAGDCTAGTEQHNPAHGDWSLSNEGPMIIHFWSNRTEDQGVYKIYLNGGSYTLPGGGTAFKYPSGCGEQASVEYHNTEFSIITLDEIMSLAENTPGGGNSGGSDPGSNCSGASNEVFASSQGQLWQFGHDGPMVVNFWSNWEGAQEGTIKFLLEPGSYEMPGGGDVTKFPANCNDAAGAAFEANPNPSGDWGYIDSLKAAESDNSGGQPGNGGSDPGTTPECEPTTTSSDSTPGAWWNISNDGPIVLNFWSNWTEDNATYKLLLEAGSYSFPGGGDATLFPSGCEDAAGAAFEANGNPAGDWDYIMSMGSSYNGEEPSPSDPGNGGEEPGNDCSATSNESFGSTPGTWWNFGHNGPIVVNFYSNWGQDQTTYKFLLSAGSYSMPGGGDVTYFPSGCDDAAGAAFEANGNTPGDWGYVMSFSAETPSTDPTEAPVTPEPTVEIEKMEDQGQEAVEETTPVPTEETVDPTEAPKPEETEVDPTTYGGIVPEQNQASESTAVPEPTAVPTPTSEAVDSPQKGETPVTDVPDADELLEEMGLEEESEDEEE